MGIGMVAEIASSIACGKTGAVSIMKEEPSNLVATCAIFLAADCNLSNMWHRRVEKWGKIRLYYIS
jgi:hypothetical protein